MKPAHDTFYADVFNIVSQIPRGKVLTYGRIAELAGWPSHARMVGRALKDVPGNMPLPCHRVVNASGRTAPNWPGQAARLQAEGVTFRKNGCVELGLHLWQPQVP